MPKRLTKHVTCCKSKGLLQHTASLPFIQCTPSQFLSVAADIPLKKAVAGVRVGLLPELGFVVNPTVQQMEESKLDLIMAGTDSAVLMIEGYCDFLTEDQMLEVSFPGTSHAVPGMSLLSQGHLLLSQGHLLLPGDISCFPGTRLQNTQCTYMLVG